MSEKRKRKTLKERGYRQIVIPAKLYDELAEAKGDKSFAEFLTEIYEIAKVSISKGMKEQSISIHVEKEVEAKPSMEYRSHLCRDCSFDAKGVEHCRIRQYQYAIYGLECPRQAALKASLK
jgi:predicted CopG family antitoxin